MGLPRKRIRVNCMGEVEYTRLLEDPNCEAHKGLRLQTHVMGK